MLMLLDTSYGLSTNSKAADCYTYRDTMKSEKMLQIFTNLLVFVITQSP